MSGLTRAMRRAGLAKPGYGRAAGGCPHTLARFTAKHERTATLVRATFPCVHPAGHDSLHRTAGGKEWP